MKINRLFIGLGLSCALVLSACEKIVEVEPEFVLDRPQFFRTVQDYEYALTGTYALLRQVGYYGSGAQTTGTWSVLPDMMSDNLVQTGEDLGNWVNQVNFFYTADEDDIDVAWSAAYNVINQANLVLANIDEVGAEEPERVNRIKGQALAIRGMVHFDLLRYFGENYERNSTGLGVPYKTAFDPEEMPSRLTVKETYDRIFADLTAALTAFENMDQNINSASNRAFIDDIVVQALLARINLYAKEYTTAESFATMVIDAKPLASKTDFSAIWSDASLAEVIWSVTFSAGQGDPGGSNVHAAASNRNRFRPATPLLNTYDKSNDIRFPIYFGTRQSGNVSPGRTIYPGTPEVYTSAATPVLITRRVLTKFVRSRSGVYDNQLNWKALRTGEMYLIRAEARAMQGAAKALLGLNDLNTLRAARINNYVSEVFVDQALLDAIALERRRELVGEGHRWFDLKRTTRSLNRTDVSLNSTVRTLPSTAREWVWPIPQTEIDANENISSQQSPNY